MATGATTRTSELRVWQRPPATLGLVAAGSGQQLYLRPINQTVGVPLRGGVGSRPFVSPDGEWVGFIGGSTLQKVSVFGGAAVLLTQAPGSVRGADWGTDDQIIFGSASGGLFRVAAAGGEPEPVSALDSEHNDTSHRWPSFISGRNAVLFVTGSPDNWQLAVLDLETREVARLGIGGVSPHYASTGHLVYLPADRSVRAVPFDATSLAVRGSPVPLVEGVGVRASGEAVFNISDQARCP